MKKSPERLRMRRATSESLSLALSFFLSFGTAFAQKGCIRIPSKFIVGGSRRDQSYVAFSIIFTSTILLRSSNDSVVASNVVFLKSNSGSTIYIRRRVVQSTDMY